MGRLEVSGPLAELGFLRRDLTAAPSKPGDRYVWYNPNGIATLWGEQKGDLLFVDSGGSLRITGEVQLPKTKNGNAAFTNRLATAGEGDNPPATLQLDMNVDSRTGFFGFPWEFQVGEASSAFGGVFTKTFSINSNGDLFCFGSKSGYVVDYFINAAGEIVEQGDVVILQACENMRSWGANGDVPVPEISLTDQAYDHRVCGVVASFVREADLPSVDRAQMMQESTRQTGHRNLEHPLLAYATPASEQVDRRKVGDKRMGRMVTLGAFTHCKVDADIASIAAGDLLTTSPTKGHAQKALDRQKTGGAVVGKALACLEKGTGEIPILVMLQ